MASTFKNTAAALAFITIGVAGAWTFSRLTHSDPLPATTAATAERKPLYWYDPMVPAQKFDKPGKSPFMDMQLVPRYAEEGQPAAGVEPALAVSAQAQQALGLRLATVALQSVAAAVTLRAACSSTNATSASCKRAPPVLCSAFLPARQAT